MRTSNPISKKVSDLSERTHTDRTLEVKESDLVYIFRAIEELNRFFHQPLNYTSLEDLRIYLEGGGYDLLHNIYYAKLPNMLSDDMLKQIEEAPSDDQDSNDDA